MSNTSVTVNQPTSSQADKEIDAELIAAAGPQESKPLVRERVQIGGDALAKVAEVTDTDPATDAMALVSRPAGPLPDVSSSGDLTDINSTVSLNLQGRRYCAVAFDDQTSFDASVGVKATTPEGNVEHRLIWDGNRQPRDGLATFPNGVNGAFDGDGVTIAVALEPGDVSVQVFVGAYTSGSVHCTITAGDRPNGIVAFNAGAALFIDGGNPAGSASTPYTGLAIGGDDNVTTPGTHIGRILAVQPSAPAGTENGAVVRPIGRNSEATGTLAAVNDAVTIDLAGMAGAQFDIESSTLSGTLKAEVLIGLTWRSVLIQDGTSLAWNIAGLVNPTAGTYLPLMVPGAKQIRIRCTLRASGSATVYLTGTNLVSAATLVPHISVPGSNSPIIGANVTGVDAAGVARSLPIQAATPVLSSYGVATRDIPMGRTLKNYFYNIPSQVHVASANTVHWDLFNADASLVVRVTSIKQLPNFTTAVTGIVFDWLLERTTAVGTGGSALTAWLADLNDTALDADITARTKPTGGATESTDLFNYSLSSEETNTATQIIATLGGLELVPEALRPSNGGKGIVLRPSQGIRCVQVTSSNAGNTGWFISFTVD